MNTAFSELQKSILEKHYQRYLTAHRFFKAMQLQYLYEFLKQSGAFAPLCTQLEKDAEWQFGNFRHQIITKLEPFPLHDQFGDRIKLIYLVVQHIATNRGLDALQMYRIGKSYGKGNISDESDQFGVFNMLFVDPLIAWLQTNIDTNLVILDQLKRYRYSAEWFNARRLYNLYTKDSKHAEAILGADLYGHLYEKGINFQLEPNSPGGRVDYIGAQEKTKDRIMIETKVYGDGRSKAYILKGFHQLHTYLKEVNEPRGYLVIYNVSRQNLYINTDVNEEGIHFYTYGNTQIYFIVINIFIHEKPASKRGLGTIMEINARDLS